MTIQKEDRKAFTVKFPVSILDEIDQICASNYVTRTSWLIKASKLLLETERMESTESMLAKIIEKERKENE
jgi:metal-responsive CopG/Arc/MetJ family transcriptional regulator